MLRKFTYYLNIYLLLTNIAAATEVTHNTEVIAYTTSSASLTLTNMSFGTYTSTANLDTTAVLTVTATFGTYYLIEMDNGLYSTSSATRRMENTNTNITDYLTYQIYTDSARTKIWTTGLSGGVIGQGNGGQQPVTAYGRIPSGQAVSVGSYSDTITVTLSY